MVFGYFNWQSMVHVAYSSIKCLLWTLFANCGPG